jgi:hypothetical protein
MSNPLGMLQVRMRGPVRLSRGRFWDRIEKCGLCGSQPFPDRNLRYKPEDRCNGCFRYSSNFRYKRQTLPRTHRSSYFEGRGEILPAGRHNRYKPQSLTRGA